MSMPTPPAAITEDQSFHLYILPSFQSYITHLRRMRRNTRTLPVLQEIEIYSIHPELLVILVFYKYIFLLYIYLYIFIYS